jgi:hypothetical protein
MTDEQPVMIACAPGETLAETRARAQAPVPSLALLLLSSPC